MDYIDREAFLVTIERMKRFQLDADDIAEMLQNFPAADVAPVVHAKWEKKDFYTRVCSACGFAIDMGTDSPILIIANYCLSCGAKME